MNHTAVKNVNSYYYYDLKLDQAATKKQIQHKALINFKKMKKLLLSLEIYY